MYSDGSLQMALSSEVTAAHVALATRVLETPDYSKLTTTFLFVLYIVAIFIIFKVGRVSPT